MSDQLTEEDVGHYCQTCGAYVSATWDGGVLTCDNCEWVIYK